MRYKLRKKWYSSEYRAIKITYSWRTIYAKPCSNNQFVIDEGKIDYNICDEKGAKLEKEAAELYSINRVRCVNCNKDFCKKCGHTSYHIGMTCEQKEYMKTAKYFTKQDLQILQRRNQKGAECSAKGIKICLL